SARPDLRATSCLALRQLPLALALTGSPRRSRHPYRLYILMRAMILAAGRGERMRPLTDHTPKPLLEVGGKPLIVWHIQALVAAGIRDIVINHAWLGDKIVARLGDGRAHGARLAYSAETQALETAGGIRQALDFFDGEPFLVINGDVWCDWSPARAEPIAHALEDSRHLGWILLTDNPLHHPDGDFSIAD